MSIDIRKGRPVTTRSNQGGRLRLGKKSIDIRATATRLARTMAATRTMTVIGRRRAKTIGFMGSVPSESVRCPLDGLGAPARAMVLSRDPGSARRRAGRARARCRDFSSLYKVTVDDKSDNP